MTTLNGTVPLSMFIKPGNFDDESIVLGAILFRPADAKLHLGKLTPELFCHQTHRRIAAIALYDLCSHGACDHNSIGARVANGDPAEAEEVARMLADLADFAEVAHPYGLNHAVDNLCCRYQSDRLKQETAEIAELTASGKLGLDGARNRLDALSIEQARPSFVTARDLVKHFPKLRPPLIHGLLRRGEIMNIIAPPKVGKSWLIADLALSVASGRSWLNKYAVERGRVLLIDNELHGETLADRLPRIALARGIPGDEWLDNVCIENLRGRLVDIHRMADYFNQIRAGEFDLIVLDALYRFITDGEGESAPAAMASAYNCIDRYATQTGASFAAVHHSTKGDQSSKSVVDVGAGTSAQSRAADTHLILREHEEDDVYVLDAVVRSWPPIEPTCIAKRMPVFDFTNLYDPSKLRKGSRSKPKVEQIPPDEPWTKERFASAFVTSDLQTKVSVIDKAKRAGLSGRQADELMRLAVENSLVTTETLPGKRTVYVRLTLNETLHAHPPDPPESVRVSTSLGQGFACVSDVTAGESK